MCIRDRSYSVGGRTKMLTLRAEDVPAVAAAVARYAELEAAFRELRRVIRPSGVAMVGFHSGTGAHAKTEGYGGHPMRVQVHRPGRPMWRGAGTAVPEPAHSL